MDFIEAICKKDTKTVQTKLITGDNPNLVITQDVIELRYTETKYECPDISSWTIPVIHKYCQDHGNSSVDKVNAYNGRQDFGNNSPEKGNQTRAIHIAVLSNCLPIVQLLHGAGADLSMKDDAGLTAFHLACTHGHLVIAQYLVEADPSSVHTIQDNTGNSALMSAIIHHQHHMYSFLLNHIDLNAVNNTRQTPLILAVSHRQLTLISALLKAGVTVDRRCKPSGDTALHVAVHHNLPQVVTILLTAGAAASKANDQGDTPIMMAIKLGFIDCVKELLIPSLPAQSVQVYLHLAAAYAHESVLRFLLRNTTWTLDMLAKSVIIACNKRQYSSLKLLLSRITPQQLRHCFCEYERDDALTQAVAQCIENDDVECVSLLLTEKTLILDFFSKYSNIYRDTLDNGIPDCSLYPFNNHLTKYTWFGVILRGHNNILKLLLGMVHDKYPSMHTLKTDVKNSLIEATVAPKSRLLIVSIIAKSLENLEFLHVCIETGIVDVTYTGPGGETYLSELLDYPHGATFPHALTGISLHTPLVKTNIRCILDLARVFINGGCPIREPTTPEHADLIQKAVSIGCIAFVWELLDAAPLPWKCTTNIDLAWYKGKKDSAFSTVIKLILLSAINVEVMSKEAGQDQFAELKEELFTLYDLCRTAIRVHLPHRRLSASRSLPIPSRLAQSIALLDICEPDLRTYENIMQQNTVSL